jgi:3-methyladenine DNA glycosylase/8-oxoguanine DNA glycosylase
MIEVRAEVRPPWPYRLPRGGGMDGVLRVRGGVVHRLVHVGDEPAIVRVAQPSARRVVFGAQAASEDVAAAALERMRFALGVDDDLRPFYERFRHDPLIGCSVRARPWLRVVRRPDPFEALAWAICEQLIELTRASEIERRIVARWGRRCPRTGLRDLPPPSALGALAPAQLQAVDLSAGRSLALVKAAREVARGRADLHAPDHERVWRRLRAIPGIGAWTVEVLALHGQGRYDQLPAGDLGFLKLVGRLDTGNPRARADEARVRELFAPYGEWKGLAGAHAIGASGGAATLRATRPRPAGTRSSGRARSAAA